MHLQEDFFAAVGDLRLACVKAYPQTAMRGVALLVHGLGGQKNNDTYKRLAPCLSQAGFASLRFDFPGHGESEGSTLDLTINSGALVVDAMAEVAAKHFQGLPLSLFGASFGGTCILQSKSIEKSVAVVLRSPVSDYAARLKRLGKEVLTEWQKQGKTDKLVSQNRDTSWQFYSEAEEADIYKRAAALKAPLLLVQGTGDAVVPMADTRRLREAWGGRADLIQVEDGDHSLSDTRHIGLFTAMGLNWLNAYYEHAINDA